MPNNASEHVLLDDQRIAFSFDNLAVRGQIVRLDKALHDVLQNAPDSFIDRALLGEALAATCMIGGGLKLSGNLIVQWQGDGALGTLVSQVNHLGQLRGIIRSEGETASDITAWQHLESADQGVGNPAFRRRLGKGRLVITMDAEDKNRYQGIVAIEGDSIADSLAAYYLQSEQLPTRFWLCCDGSQAVGLMLQQLPQVSAHADSEAVTDDDKNLAQQAHDWQYVNAITDTLGEHELLTLSPETLLFRLFHQDAVRMYSPQALEFSCQCSLPRIQQVIRQLGEQEIRDTLAEMGEIEINCEFCAQQYRFEAHDIDELFAQDSATNKIIH